jgi:hypothetical protein
MRAEEIRKIVPGHPETRPESGQQWFASIADLIEFQCVMLQEIAAQLAELMDKATGEK